MDSTWVELTWESPTNDGGSRILSYSIEYRDPSSREWKAWPLAAKDTRYRLDGLRDCGEYEFRVAARNAAGLGRWSPSSGPVKLRPKFSVPGPPGMPYANSIGRQCVNLTWTPPVQQGGCKLTGMLCFYVNNYLMLNLNVNH